MTPLWLDPVRLILSCPTASFAPGLTLATVGELSLVQLTVAASAAKDSAVTHPRVLLDIEWFLVLIVLFSFSRHTFGDPSSDIDDAGSLC